MKTMTLFFIFSLCSGCASNRFFVDRGGFNEVPFVVGEGASSTAAKQNALLAIPDSHEREANEFVVSSCAVKNEHPVWQKDVQDYICPSAHYQTSIRVLPKSAIERKEILDQISSKYGTRYTGKGKTTDDAIADLVTKIPKGAVIEGWGTGCTVKISIDLSTGHGFCDESIEGNMREVDAHTRAPNVNQTFSSYLGSM
jgi:hypothetical protein